MAKRVLFWFLTALLVFSPIAGAELCLRAWGLGHPVLYNSVGNSYAPRPNQKLRRLNGATITVGSTGLRGTSDWQQEADRHILFIGDSITWGGSRINDRDTFSEVACGAVARSTATKIVCGNGGVDSYGIDNMLERLSLIHGWDTVVVTLIANDTIRGTTDFKGLPYFSKAPVGPFKACWEAVGILTFRLAETLLKAPHWQDMSDLGRADRALARLFEALHAAAAAGRTVLLVYSPGENDVPVPPFSAHVRTAMGGSGLPFLDLTDAVAGAAGQTLYLDGTHPNAAGHRLYGEAIARALSSLYKAG